MKLMPVKESKKDNRERMVSFVCGVPSLTLGIGGMILLFSYVVGMPIGSQQFYNVELVSDDAKDALGKRILMKPTEYIVPSTLMLWMLWLGACCGGLGMHLTRVRWANRSARTSASGLIACSAAFALSWLLYARAFL
jgi:hypothetical protein